VPRSFRFVRITLNRFPTTNSGCDTRTNFLRPGQFTAQRSVKTLRPASCRAWVGYLNGAKRFGRPPKDLAPHGARLRRGPGFFSLQSRPRWSDFRFLRQCPLLKFGHGALAKELRVDFSRSHPAATFAPQEVTTITFPCGGPILGQRLTLIAFAQ
jgi:hypothetical protein